MVITMDIAWILQPGKKFGLTLLQSIPPLFLNFQFVRFLNLAIFCDLIDC